MALRELAKDWVPPALLRGLQRLVRALNRKGADQGPIEFSGPYASWNEAARACSGYANPSILEKTRAALLKVKRGEAVYERDSVLFNHIEYSYPLLANLLYVASLHGNRLSVLDFGGSLGSSYFQNRGYLGHLAEFAWCIVDQRAYFEVGKRDLEDGVLRFFETPQACLQALRPSVLLLSSVLQYLERPLEFLGEAVGWGIPFIIIDRTPLVRDRPSRLTIQTVPPSIYEARYPCWILNESEALEPLRASYRMRDAFDTHHGTVIRLQDAVATYRGFFLEKRDAGQARA